MGVLVILAVVVLGAFQRGEGAGTITALVLAVLIGGGLVLGCYAWARRKL